jgi:hypothetical protein
LSVLMDNLSYMMGLINGYYEDERGWRHYRVEGKDYDIRFNPRTLENSCSCKGFIYRRKCKHIKNFRF